jgi:chemotaxis protein CheX
MDVKYVNPFVAATRAVFKTMLGIDVSMDKPRIKGDKMAFGDVTGVMGLVGDKKGTVSISFTQKGALFAYKTLVGDDGNGMSPEVIDAIGELTNIISGQARKELENAGINLKASIPTVVVGKEVQLHFVCAFPIVSLPFHFSTDNGQEAVYVDFSLE